MSDPTGAPGQSTSTTPPLASVPLPLRAGLVAGLATVPVAGLVYASLSDDSGGFWAVFLIPLIVLALLVAVGLGLRWVGVRKPFLGGLLVALAYPIVLFTLGSATAEAPGTAFLWPVLFGVIGGVCAAACGPREESGASNNAARSARGTA